MSERLTVTFEDENLYRRLKMRSAESGAPLKRLIEDAVRAYLAVDYEAARDEIRPVDWDAFWKWQDETDEIAGELDLPADLSDVKGHLYGEKARTYPRLLMLAEEREPYDASPPKER